MNVTVINVTVERKQSVHEFFDEGSPVGYAINWEQGKVLVMERGRRYQFVVRTPHHPFYFTTDSTGSPSDRTGMVQLPGARQDTTDATFTVTIPVDYSGPEQFYFQCHAHPKMGGIVKILGERIEECFHCHARNSAYVCKGCEAVVYCGLKCQLAAWREHRSVCDYRGFLEEVTRPENLLFLATGYFVGTMHHVKVSFPDGTFTDHSRQVTKLLSSVMADRIRHAADMYVELGKFHLRRKSDEPQCSDRGVARFIYGNLFASPADIPELARIFLTIEPRLANDPGGLRVEN